MNKRAAKLLELLDEHVLVQDYAGTHYGTAANNGFPNFNEEKESYAELQALAHKLMRKCDDAGFEYQLLLELIPPPFETNNQQRNLIYQDLKKYAEKKYG